MNPQHKVKVVWTFGPKHARGHVYITKVIDKPHYLRNEMASWNMSMQDFRRRR